MRRIAVALLLSLVAPVCGAASAAPDTPAGFNAEDYALAYDAFMGAGDLESAFRLARKAVAGRPADPEWRRRLARLAEWTRRPQIAWENREFLFRGGDRCDETLAAVIRLAPLADNPDAALEAWQIQADRTSPTPAQWEDVFNLFESVAKPRQGSLFFEGQFRRRRGDVRLLDYAARLAENTGQDERALRLYGERLKLKPFSVDAALSSAILLLRGDRTREAYALMAEHRSEAPAEAAEFWRVFGETAWELGELNAAEQAYRRYTEKPQATAADWSRLVFLVRERHPAQAAQLALEAYRRRGGLDYLLLALDIYAETGNRKGQIDAFGELKETDVPAARNNTRFLVLRGQLRDSRRQPERAWADFGRALALAPDSREVVVPALWHLIDTRRKTELVALLNRLGPSAENDAALWLPFAAGNHALDRYRDAAYWYRKEIARTPDDALLLVNYADALERLQQPGMAERIRRHAWLRLREQYPSPDLAPPLDGDPKLLALARLAILDRPGDPGLALVRSVVARLRGLPPEREAPQTDDLILGWAIAKEQFLNARAWMWLRYARSAGRLPPLWGDSQTALQTNDTETMDRLLTRDAAGMPIYNRYDTAYALEHWQQALDTAFDGMRDSDVDEDLHDRYRQHAPLHAGYAQLRASKDRYGTLDSRGRQLEAQVFATSRLSFKFDWSRLSQSASDETGPFVPGTDRLGAVEATWHRNRGNTRFALFRRSELERNTGWRLGQDWQWSARLGLDGSLEHRADATDSLPLRVAGQQDSLRFGATYALGKREYLRISPHLSRYRTQTGDRLGDGRGLDLEAGYRIRTEYPDWRVRGFASHQRYSYGGSVGAQTLALLPQTTRDAIAAGAADPVRYFLPEGSTTWGLCFGMGENLGGQNLRDVYTRGWRHFYDVCKNRNTLNGVGYAFALGVAGSVTGEDHVSLGFEQSSGGAGTGAMTRSLALRYRHYF